MTVTLIVIGGGSRVRRPGRGVGVQAATAVWSAVPSLGRPEGVARSLVPAHQAAARLGRTEESERELTLDKP